MRRLVTIPRQQSPVVPDIQNPFVHRLHLGPADILKIALMSCTVAPIRLLLAFIFLVLAWFVAKFSLLFLSKEEQKKPLNRYRNVLRPLVVFLCRGVFFAGGFHWITVKGTRARSADAPVITLAPHSSYFDALPVVFLDLTTVVAKSEAENVPFFGTIIQYTQPVFVSREDPNSRVNTIKEIRRRAQMKGQWPQIIIFPEGTCTNRSCLITFKSGGFYPGVPVQPVCIRYPNCLDTVTWTWDGPAAFTVLWLTLCQFHNYIELEFLPVYIPSNEEIEDAKLYATNMRQTMADCLKVSVTDHTYDDCRLMVKAAKLRLPMKSGIVEFHKLHKKLGMNFDAMKELLDKFCKIAKNRTGEITAEEFAQYLHLPKSDALMELFELYDRDGSGTIDFREYIIGLSVISSPVNTEETIQLAFQLFDQGNKGYIILDELTDIIKNVFGMHEADVDTLYQEVDTDKDGKITYEEFKFYTEQKPEYATLFTAFREQLKSNGHPEWIESLKNE